MAGSGLEREGKRERQDDYGNLGRRRLVDRPSSWLAIDTRRLGTRHCNSRRARCSIRASSLSSFATQCRPNLLLSQSNNNAVSHHRMCMPLSVDGRIGFITIQLSPLTFFGAMDLQNAADSNLIRDTFNKFRNLMLMCLTYTSYLVYTPFLTWCNLMLQFTFFTQLYEFDEFCAVKL